MKWNRYTIQDITLVEFFFGMIVAGLIMGGILIGRDLARAAADRAVISQIERYNAAVNIFYGKYGFLPGDILPASADQFGFLARGGSAGQGDGNNLIEGCTSGSTAAGCETILFWADLVTAHLIPTGNMALSDAYASRYIQTAATSPGKNIMHFFSPVSDANAATAASPISTILPGVAGMRSPNAFLAVYSASGNNYFQLSAFMGTDSSGIYNTGNLLSPTSAYNIDRKMDDGMPLSGRVQASVFGAQMATGASGCISGADAQKYNTATANIAGEPLCQLSFRLQ